MLENNFTRLPFIEIIIISKLLYCEHRYLNYVLLNKNLPVLWNNMLAWEQIPPHYLECGHVCACLFYCFGDFPNVNPLGSQLSSSVQMYCNWLCLRSCIQFLIFFLNRGRKIRCTSKGPIVHCEHCVLNCNKKIPKKPTTQLLNLWISATGPAISTWKGGTVIIHKVGKSFFWISDWTRISLFFSN